MNILKTPYLDQEASELNGFIYEEPHVSQQMESIFLTETLLNKEDTEELLEEDYEIIDDFFEDEDEDEDNFEEEWDDDFENELNKVDQEEFEEETHYNNYDDRYDESEYDDFDYQDEIGEDVGSEFYDHEDVGEAINENEMIEYEKSINVKRAVVKNRYWSRKLKWSRVRHKIKSFLIEMFPHISVKTEKGFAQAVELWQLFIEVKKPDGILGPKTWAKLEPHISKRTETVSPSQIPPHGVDNLLKNIAELTEDIYQAEYDIFKAWESGLMQFYVVMTSASDAEVSSKFGEVLQKYIVTSLITTLASKVTLGMGKPALALFNSLKKEQARVKIARDSASLRDFIIKFSSTLRNYLKYLRTNKADYKAQVRINYENMDRNQKASYKTKLASYISDLDEKREKGWLNGSDTFEKIAFAWIRYSKVKNGVISRDYHESFVQVWVDMKTNRSLEINSAKINAPGGRKIAEQFIKNAKKDGVRLKPYNWPVYRVMIFRRSGKWPYSVGYFSSRGTQESSRTPGVAYARTLFKRLLARKPTTIKVK